MNDKTTVFSAKLNERFNNEYIVLSEYINQTTKIRVKHKACNNEFEITPKSFISSRSKGCNHCRLAKRTKSDKTFKNEVYNLVGNEYSILSDYKKSSIKVLVKHNSCGNTYEVTPAKFLSGRRCPACFGKNKKTQEAWEKELRDLGDNEYTSLGQYINNRTKILIKHDKCNYEWEISPSNFIKGHRCPKCATEENIKKLSLGHEEFSKRLKLLNEPDYILLDEYISNTHKITFKHLTCGKTFTTLPSNFIRGNRCPHCKVGSKGEEKIKKWLNDNNLKYTKEYWFEDLRGDKEKPLRFDFAILNNDQSLKLLIEYDGRQHFIYEESSMFTEEDFKKLQKHDKEKNQYCIDNNISLIRIDYKNYNNIENILKSVILEEDSETIRKFAIHIASE